MSSPMPPGLPGWICPRRVGFLFPHDCHRTTPVGCPDCQNGQIDDPYGAHRDREGYSRYDDYDSSYFSYRAYENSSGSSPDPSADLGPEPDSSNDFTEADGSDLVQTDDQFENDMTES
jgi:hypothetical protein